MYIVFWICIFSCIYDVDTKDIEAHKRKFVVFSCIHIFFPFIWNFKPYKK